jgi:hypothetical protein
MAKTRIPTSCAEAAPVKLSSTVTISSGRNVQSISQATSRDRGLTAVYP